MTKEEIEKEAEKHADGIYHYKINVSDYGEDGIINYRYSDVKEAYLAGAESREKRIAELKSQIEKMKCCGNCSHFKPDNSGLYPINVCELIYPNICKNHEKWEIKEND